MDFTSIQARAMEVALSAKPLSTLPPLTTDRVDKMYCQLAVTHAITAMQLAECAHWRWFEPTPSPIRAGTSRQRPAVTPSVTRLAPHRPARHRL
jgi:hypothetical protein